MRRIILVALACLLMAPAAHAVNEENCGCGLGTMVFQAQEGLLFQVFAVTTNSLFGNQTFGISSGTLDCERPASFVRNERVNTFVARNMDNLAIDIAAGQGESLDTLAELMEMPAANRPAMYSALQRNFERIYPTPRVTHDFVVARIAEVVERI